MDEREWRTDTYWYWGLAQHAYYDTSRLARRLFRLPRSTFLSLRCARFVELVEGWPCEETRALRAPRPVRLKAESDGRAAVHGAPADVASRRPR